MNTIRKDIRNLITVNERLQSALARGEAFTEDEVQLIRTCASELLQTLPVPRPHSWSQPDGSADGMTRYSDHGDTSQTHSSTPSLHD